MGRAKCLKTVWLNGYEVGRLSPIIAITGGNLVLAKSTPSPDKEPVGKGASNATSEYQ
jgi:hypothetical protein